MAYIQFTEHANLQAYHNDDHMPDDYRITEISDEGVAQVTQEVADSLVEAIDSVEHYDGGSQ